MIQESGRDSTSIFGRCSNWEMKDNAKSAVYEIGSIIDVEGLYFLEV